MKLWIVHWRGRVTRDIGTRYVLADTRVDAEQKFVKAYPTRLPHFITSVLEQPLQ